MIPTRLLFAAKNAQHKASSVMPPEAFPIVGCMGIAVCFATYCAYRTLTRSDLRLKRQGATPGNASSADHE